MHDSLVNLALHFKTPFKYFMIPTKSRPVELRSVGIVVSLFTNSVLTTIHCIQYLKISRLFHIFVQVLF